MMSYETAIISYCFLLPGGSVFAACDKDDTLSVTGAGGDGNSIILDLASASLPVSRATFQATGAEVAVSHLDVLILRGTEIKNGTNG